MASIKKRCNGCHRTGFTDKTGRARTTCLHCGGRAGVWRARHRDPSGKEHARHFTRKADAERWLDEVTADVLTGRYVDPRAGQVTFKAYADTWREAQPHRPNTARQTESLLKTHVYPVFGDRTLASLRRSEIQAWASGLKLAPASVRRVYALVRAVFRSAVDDKLIPESPCRNIKLPEVADGKVVPLTVEQVRTLVAESKGELAVIVLLAATSGLRLGEVLGLRVADVDFLRRTLTVSQQLHSGGKAGPPKTKASRRSVPVPEFTIDALAAHLKERPSEDLLFSINRSALAVQWSRLLSRAKVPDSYTFHALRHHYASVLIDGGESVKVVQDRLGHASAVETLRTYSHLFPDSEDRTRGVVTAAWAEPAADSARTEAGS